jgi:lipoic acid synthetase
MLGLGEQEEEVFQTMRDLRDANVDVVTIVNTNQVKHLRLKLSHQINLPSMKIRIGIRFRHVENLAH